MVGETHETIVDLYEDSDDYFTDEFTHKYYSRDTIMILFYQKQQPLETVFLLKNDTCYHQETKIYCSPCAQTSVEQLLNDKRYRFEKIDDVNYRSSIDPRIIMRLINKGDENVCTEVKITNTAIQE